MTQESPPLSIAEGIAHAKAFMEKAHGVAILGEEDPALQSYYQAEAIVALLEAIAVRLEQRTTPP